jgi:hypothetical protein
MSLRANVSPARPTLQRLALAAILCGSTAYAQYGVSPSVTGMFFNDLRARSTENQAQAGTVTGDYTYDYEQGAYVGPDGAPATGVDGSAGQGNPLMSTGNGYTYFSQRGAGDYTRYASPYAATSGFFAPAYVSDPLLGGKRNLKLGGANIGFGLSTLTEYNSNVNRSGTNPQSDMIVGGYLNISANYQLTKRNNLTLSTVVGFEQMLENPELSPYGNNGTVLNVLPGTTLAVDGKIGPFYVVIYDRVSVRPAAANDFVLSNSQIFGVVQNDLGMASMWDINSSLSLALNYMHSDAVALEDSAEIFSRTTDSIHATLSWSPRSTWSLGVEGGYTWLRYPEEFNNGGTLGNLGVFYSTPVGESTALRVAAGYQSFSFDRVGSQFATQSQLNAANARKSKADQNLANARETAANTVDDPLTPDIDEAEEAALAVTRAEEEATGAATAATASQNSFNGSNQDNSDLSDFYYNAVITNRLSASVIQALSFGREAALNTTSNYITADYVSYGLGFVGWKGARFNLAGYYESAEESGGRLAENTEQYGFDAYVTHQISARLRMGAGFHYGIVDSNLSDRSYTQNVWNVDATYALTRKMTMQLGYRYFITNADTPEFDFEQHRVLLSLNYNF